MDTELPSKETHTSTQINEKLTAQDKCLSEEQGESDCESIDIDYFCKVKLKVGTILEVTEVPKSKKLLKLIVDEGNNKKRQILAGIKQFYSDPQELVNQQIVFVANLKPAKLAGEISEGMCLAASDHEDNILTLIGPKVQLPNGSIVR